jgi:hypothetical protein
MLEHGHFLLEQFYATYFMSNLHELTSFWMFPKVKGVHFLHVQLMLA